MEFASAFTKVSQERRITHATRQSDNSAV